MPCRGNENTHTNWFILKKKKKKKKKEKKDFKQKRTNDGRRAEEKLKQTHARFVREDQKKTTTERNGDIHTHTHTHTEKGPNGNCDYPLEDRRTLRGGKGGEGGWEGRGGTRGTGGKGEYDRKCIRKRENWKIVAVQLICTH